MNDRTRVLMCVGVGVAVVAGALGWNARSRPDKVAPNPAATMAASATALAASAAAQHAIVGLEVDQAYLAADVVPDRWIAVDQMPAVFRAQPALSSGLVVSEYLLTLVTANLHGGSESLRCMLELLLQRQHGIFVVDGESDDIMLAVRLIGVPTPWDPIGRFPPYGSTLAPNESLIGAAVLYRQNDQLKEKNGWARYTITVDGVGHGGDHGGVVADFRRFLHDNDSRGDGLLDSHQAMSPPSIW